VIPLIVLWACVFTAAGTAMTVQQIRCNRTTRTARALLRQSAEDAPLAEWCRHMSLTIVTVSGSVFSTTLAELQSSEAPTFRQWNVPTQVTLWSDLADEELTAEARMAAAMQDEADA